MAHVQEDDAHQEMGAEVRFNYRLTLMLYRA